MIGGFTPDLVIYHQRVVKDVFDGSSQRIDCMDGLVSYWAATCRWGKALPRLGWAYGDGVPDLGDVNNILVVDFSFPLSVLEGWELLGKTVVVVDHHLSAMRDLSSFSSAFFNVQECGASLLWSLLFKGDRVPALIRYVWARDTWQRDKDTPWWEFSLRGTGLVHEVLSYYRTSLGIEEFLGLLDKWKFFDESELLAEMSVLGKALLQHKIGVVESLARKFVIVSFAGYDNVLYIELSSEESRYVSDVCSCALIENRDKGVNFAVAKVGDKFEFRSDKYGVNFDVSALAKANGGGGHRNASGSPWFNGFKE